MANERKTVMVSSTARDLPEHRKEVMDACLRQGMFPDMMEQLPASDADAIRVSLEMADRADIYIGIFAHRYGYVPKENNPKQISVTEMEYNRAVERNIPRLIFIMHDDHKLKASDVETGEGAEKIKKLKDRIGKDRVAGFFKSPVDLRAQVIQALVPYRESDITQFHYVSNIPQPPEAYIAHPYTLLQTHRLIGRQKELNLLTNWVTKKQDEIYATRIMNIVAIGGMGKSALTWKWFNDIAPQEMNPLAGRMWWSFYESDATFENFIIRTLAYVNKRSREDVEKNIKSGEREEQLLQILDHEPYLLVLDGLERILIAYARMDAARLSDDDIDQRTANFVTKAYGLPESAAQSFVGQHHLRKTTDPRAGSFMRKLANTRSARILVSTRLYPADLQSVTGEPIRGCSAIFLPGLSDDDALNLWRAFNVSGSHEQLLPLFNQFENHPLLMQSLASEVATYRRAPRDYERWQKDHPDFDPFSLPMTQVKGHVLAFAMQGLYKNARKVLETIAAFRMPAQYDTLAAIFVGEGKVFSTELGLDQALKELEDRGLLGWDKRANRYDLHPIVRGVVWNGLTDNTRNGVFASLQAHFDSIPKVNDEEIQNLEDLTPAIELYNTLIGLGKYMDAADVYMNRLGQPMFFLNLARLSADLLALTIQHLSDWQVPAANADEAEAMQSVLFTILGTCYQYSGQPGKASEIYRHHFHLLEKYLGNSEKDSDILGFIVLGIESFLHTGAVYEAEAIARRLIKISKSANNKMLLAITKEWWSLTLAYRGMVKDAKQHLATIPTSDGWWSNAHQTQIAIWEQKFALSEKYARTYSKSVGNFEREAIRAQRLQGITTLSRKDFIKAKEYLNDSLTRSRAVNLVDEELVAFITLAELNRQQKELTVARELLENVWEIAERGPYPLFQTDAFNVLAQIERDQGNKDKAIEAATKAYCLAWCDGPPFAYHWGLEKAKQLLKELGAPEPEMLPFDESKFEPMPEVEINPKDEFWVNPDKDFNIDELLSDDES